MDTWFIYGKSLWLTACEVGADRFFAKSLKTKHPRTKQGRGTHRVPSFWRPKGGRILSDAKVSQFRLSRVETISNIRLKSSGHPVLKGHGFSRAVASVCQAALAAEGSPFITS